jgi:hypothetical protein
MGLWDESARRPKDRSQRHWPGKLPAAVMSCVVLLTAALTMASCGSDDLGWLGTSPVHAAASDAALKLGDAVVAYFGGKLDLAVVEGLVVPSAHESRAQMLSSLGEPTACTVTETASYVSSSEVWVVLRFADAKSKQPEFTLTVVVHPDRTTIMGINPRNTADSTNPSPQFP